MSGNAPARTAGRRIRSTIVVVLAVASATLIVVVAGQSVGKADGAVPGGLTVFDDDIPAVANLDPGLLRALRKAARDAAKDGIEIVVNGGWRSRKHQKQLWRDAVAKYGSEMEAARWVAPPDTSSHVSGHAVDIGPSRARAWLARHGAGYRLCRIYRNEPWHYELRPEAIDDGCPSMYADPGHDPRSSTQGVSMSFKSVAAKNAVLGGDILACGGPGGCRSAFEGSTLTLGQVADAAFYYPGGR
jgi:zinc D-Ala-D-Ala carboxypeptidase